MLALMGLVDKLVAVNEGVLPTPLLPRPIAVFEFVHTNEVDGLLSQLLAET